MKFTKESIISFIDDRLNGMTWSAISLKYNVSNGLLRGLFKRYQLHGIDSLFHKPSNYFYSFEFKNEICERALNGESKSSLAAEIGVNIGTIYAWLKKYQDKGYNSFKETRGRPKKDMPKKKISQEPLTDKEREELNELRKRNKQLEMELELTKKLTALVQERIKLETKKK